MKNIAYLSLVLFSLKSTAQSPIYPWSDGHRWGLTNANLEIIAKPQFDTTVFFGKESFGIAIKGKKHGVLGRDGKTKLDFTYDNIYTYGDGFGQGYTKSNGSTKEGYTKLLLLDLRAGKVVSQEPYDLIWHYCSCADKIFSVKKDTQTLFISAITGKQLGKATYQGIAEFLPARYDGGTNMVVVKTNGKLGVLNAKTGTWIVPAKYDEISQTFHHEQIAIAVKAKGVTEYLGYNGKPIPNPAPKAGDKEKEVARIESTHYEREWDSKELYVYNQGGGNWKLSIETRGSGGTKVHETFEVKGYADVAKISYYDEQHTLPALIKAVKDGKTGIIDLKGEVLVPFIYDNIEEVKIHSFFLQTTVNNKIGVLRRDLTELSKPVMKQILAEETRLNAWYIEMPNGYRGYMDRETGKIFIPRGE